MAILRIRNIDGNVQEISVIKGDSYVLTEEDKAEIAKLSNTVEIPDYWQEHISEKISSINANQIAWGKDCFSFIVMTDMHYPSNLGKISPILAKEITEKCNIKFVLCLGDTQTRGCHSTNGSLLTENESIEKMLLPIRDRLLQTEGNHDGAYGLLDRDGDGTISNTAADGSDKPPAERESYVSNLTPAKIHSAIYRKVGMIGDVHFDESGSGYYIDDTANKVRYVILNTQNNEYKLREDGTVLYPKMWLFRFGQSQFELLIEALNNIPTDSWSVVVAGHCSITSEELGDGEIMQGVLNAYKNKTAYSGTYEGTAAGGAAYVNLAEPLPENTTDTTKWVNGYRFSSTGIAADDETTLSNLITCKNGDVIRIKGVTLREGTDRIAVYGSAIDGQASAYFNNDLNSGNETLVKYNGLSEGVYTFTIQTGINHTITGFRFAMETPADANSVIVTVNEEIVNSAHGYDYVNVSADFTTAKGKLTGYFHGHNHRDSIQTICGFHVIGTRCDAAEENDATLKAERVEKTITEQSFDVFTVNKAQCQIHVTKIGAGTDRFIDW